MLCDNYNSNIIPDTVNGVGNIGNTDDVIFDVRVLVDAGLDENDGSTTVELDIIKGNDDNDNDESDNDDDVGTIVGTKTD